jgi:UDP-N-acetylglucosamine 3-dehydrogenase
MPPIDVLVVGIGRWGERHLATLKEMQDDGEIGKLYAYDIDESRREIAKIHGAIWAPSTRRRGMAAIVSTTTASHFEVASCLIAEGIHVLIEKPMAQNLVDANALMNEALANGVIIETGLLLRHHSAIKHARLLIAEGEIGEIERIDCFRHSSRTQGDDESIIDVLAIHYLDLCCHLLHEAEPDNISANIETRASGVSCRIAMEFKPGIEAFVEVSWGAHEEIRRLEISGTQGTIEIEFSEHDRLAIGKEEVLLTDSTTPLRAELGNFLSQITSGNDCISTIGRSALRSVTWKDRVLIINADVAGMQEH